MLFKGIEVVNIAAYIKRFKMFLNIKQLFGSILLLAIFAHSRGENTLERLKNHITMKQNVHIRNMSATFDLFFNIVIDFLPVALIGLNEANQVFSFSGIVIAGWMDESIAWDPSDYNSTFAVSIQASMLWTPQLAAINSVVRIDTALQGDTMIFSNGYIMAFYADSYQTSCQLDTEFFPFDEQTCDVLLMPTGLYHFFADKSEITEPEFFFNSNEWQLVSVTLQNRSYVPTMMRMQFSIKTVAVQFKLKRYSSFYVLSILGPVEILSLMNACVFLLPVESGEKISYLVSILVSYAMFLNFIYSTMPKSDSQSRLTIYLLLVVTQSCMSIAVTIYSLNVYHDSGHVGLSSAFSRVSWNSKAKVNPDSDNSKAFTEKLMLKKMSTRKTDRFLFFLFSLLAVLTLLVFVEFKNI